jgi:hypothetical protein
MAFIFRNLTDARTLFIFTTLYWMSVPPAVALETVSPGGSVNFAVAENCSTLLEIPHTIPSMARTHADCDAASRLLKAETKPIVGAGGLSQPTRATATLSNDFVVAADPDTLGNTVGAWISYDAHWNGRLLFIGFISPPAVELTIRLRDVSDHNKVIKGELIWGRDGKGMAIGIPDVPIDLNLGGGVDRKSVSNTFSAVLTRGHRYRIEMSLACTVFSDGGGLDIGVECDYMDDYVTLSNGFDIVNHDGGAGWSKLSVKVGLDETEILRKIEELTHHTHIYLTGRGTGHNNTEAVTSVPVDGTGGTTPPAPVPAPGKPGNPGRPGGPMFPLY